MKEVHASKYDFYEKILQYCILLLVKLTTSPPPTFSSSFLTPVLSLVAMTWDDMSLKMMYPPVLLFLRETLGYHSLVTQWFIRLYFMLLQEIHIWKHRFPADLHFFLFSLCIRIWNFINLIKNKKLFPCYCFPVVVTQWVNTKFISNVDQKSLLFIHKLFLSIDFDHWTRCSWETWGLQTKIMNKWWLTVLSWKRCIIGWINVTCIDTFSPKSWECMKRQKK